MPTLAGMDYSTEIIAEFCRKHHITKFAFFGSVLTDKFGPDSDVDVLVEFDREHIPGLLDIAGMEFELSDLFDGRKVDIRTPKDLSRYFREKVAETAAIQYEQEQNHASPVGTSYSITS